MRDLISGLHESAKSDQIGNCQEPMLSTHESLTPHKQASFKCQRCLFFFAFPCSFADRHLKACRRASFRLGVVLIGSSMFYPLHLASSFGCFRRPWMRRTPFRLHSSMCEAYRWVAHMNHCTATMKVGNCALGVVWSTCPPARNLKVVSNLFCLRNFEEFYPWCKAVRNHSQLGTSEIGRRAHRLNLPHGFQTCHMPFETPRHRPLAASKAPVW